MFFHQKANSKYPVKLQYFYPIIFLPKPLFSFCFQITLCLFHCFHFLSFFLFCKGGDYIKLNVYTFGNNGFNLLLFQIMTEGGFHFTLSFLFINGIGSVLCFCSSELVEIGGFKIYLLWMCHNSQYLAGHACNVKKFQS